MWTQSLVAMETILDVWRQCIPRRYVWTRLKTCSISLSRFVSPQSNSRLAVEQVRRSKSQEIRIRNRKTSTEKSPNPIVNSPPKVSSVMAFLSSVDDVHIPNMDFKLRQQLLQKLFVVWTLSLISRYPILRWSHCHCVHYVNNPKDRNVTYYLDQSQSHPLLPHVNWPHTECQWLPQRLLCNA